MTNLKRTQARGSPHIPPLSSTPQTGWLPVYGTAVGAGVGALALTPLPRRLEEESDEARR